MIGVSVVIEFIVSLTSMSFGVEFLLVPIFVVLVPYASGKGELQGDVEALRCRPPDPAAGKGEW